MTSSQPVSFSLITDVPGILARISHLLGYRGTPFGEASPITVDSSVEVILTNRLSQAAKDVEASQDALIDLFERIENFFKRLESYTSVPPTDAMTDIIVKIMIEVLNIFAIATKEMRQGRASAFLSVILDRR